MSYSPLLIYKRDGSFLTTIHSEATRSWVLRDFGTCELTMPISDAKAVARYMQIGNLIYIPHDTLPAWGGKLLPPIEFNDDETVTFTAYSGEALLKMRRSTWQDKWTAASAGALYKMLIARGNNTETLHLRFGEIWEGGTAAQDTMDGKSVYAHVKTLSDSRDADWNIDPYIDGQTQKMYFSAGWWKKRGAAQQVWLREGHNIKKRNSPMSVQRWIVNDMLGIGDGSDSARPIARATDAASIAKYGLFQDSKDFPGVSAQATLNAHAAAQVQRGKEPRYTHRITVLNKGDIFASLRLGNILNYKTLTLGFSGLDGIGVDTKVRILGMKYVEKRDEVDLVVDEDV